MSSATRDLPTIGLFDIMQIDPTDPADHGDVYRRRLDHLATADALGLEIAFTAERHFMPHYRCPAASAWVGAASQRTSRIRLGVLAYTLPLHPPVQLAEEIAVLDHLSGGRLEVGVGLGHRVQELEALGIDPSERIEIFQERLAVMEALWTGNAVSLETRHTSLRDVAITPTPAQQPHPPVWYAGVDAGAAGWAGVHGLSVAVGFAPLRDLLPAAAAFRQGAAEVATAYPGAVRPPGAGRVALMRHVYVAETDERARDEMIDDIHRLQSLGAESPGDRPDRRDAAAAEQARLVREEIFIAGSPETVALQLSLAQTALGMNVFLGNVYAAGVDDARIERAIRLLATDVKAALAALPAPSAPISA